MHRFVLLALAAVGFALVVACSDGGSDAETASLIHRLLQASSSDQGGDLETFVGELPDSLPVEPPLYPDADLIVSSRQPATTQVTPTPNASGDISQPLLYLIVLDTGDSRGDVFSFYEEALEEDPWQLESTFSSEDVDTLEFSNVSDADLTGIVTIARGGEDNRTSILISMQDAGAFREELPPYEQPEDVPVPAQWPEDVPVYEDGIVTASAFVKEPANESFLLTFLTEDTAERVVDFYRTEFQEMGWVVQDAGPLGVEGSTDFQAPDGSIQGSILANAFAADPSFTEVSVQFRQDPAREPGEPLETTATTETVATPPPPTAAPTVAGSPPPP